MKIDKTSYKGPYQLSKDVLGDSFKVILLGDEEIAEFYLTDLKNLSVTIVPSPEARGSIIFKGSTPKTRPCKGYPTLPHCEQVKGDSGEFYHFHFLDIDTATPLTMAKVMEEGDVAILLGVADPKPTEATQRFCEAYLQQITPIKPHPVLPFPRYDSLVSWEYVIENLKGE